MARTNPTPQKITPRLLDDINVSKNAFGDSIALYSVKPNPDAQNGADSMKKFIDDLRSEDGPFIFEISYEDQITTFRFGVPEHRRQQMRRLLRQHFEIYDPNRSSDFIIDEDNEGDYITAEELWLTTPPKPEEDLDGASQIPSRDRYERFLNEAVNPELGVEFTLQFIFQKVGEKDDGTELYRLGIRYFVIGDDESSVSQQAGELEESLNEFIQDGKFTAEVASSTNTVANLLQRGVGYMFTNPRNSALSGILSKSKHAILTTTNGLATLVHLPEPDVEARSIAWESDQFRAEVPPDAPRPEDDDDIPTVE